MPAGQRGAKRKHKTFVPGKHALRAAAVIAIRQVGTL